MAECTPLMIDRAPLAAHTFITRRCSSNIPLVAVVLVVFIALYGILGPAIWFTNNSGVLSTDSNLTVASPFPIQPILPGDCVQITYVVDRGSLYNTFHMRFSNVTSDNNSNSAQIFVTDQNSLDITYERFRDPEPKVVMMDFSSSFNRTCFFDWFVYFTADGNNSFILYNITNDNFTTQYPVTTKFQVLAFNSLERNSNPLKTVTMDTNNLTFTLNGTEIGTSSYLYFAIKLIDSDFVGSPIIQFSISAMGTVPFYNTTAITPYCTVDDNNSCQVTTSVESCVLVCIHDKYDLFLRLPSEEAIVPATITISVEGPFTSFIGYCILFLPYSVVFVLSISCCLMCCVSKCTRKRRIWIDIDSCTASFVNPNDERSGHTGTISIYKNLHCKEMDGHDEECTEECNSVVCSVNQEVSKDEGYYPDTVVENSETLTSCDEEDDEQYYISPPEDSSVGNNSPACTVDDKDEVIEHVEETASPLKKDRDPRMKNITKVEFNRKGLRRYFKHCGVTVIIPKNAVRDKATLELGTSVLLPGFTSEGHRHIPVSPFIWVHVSEQLSSPATIYIPHGIDTRHVKLVVLVKGHEDGAVFRVREDLTQNLRLSKSVACVEMTHFCTLCLAVDSNGNPPKQEYHVTAFERTTADHRMEVHLCILNNFMCFDRMKLEETYLSEGFTQSVGLEPIKRSSQDHATTKEVEFTLSTDLSPTSTDWKVTQFKKSMAKITESDIDVFKFLKCDPKSVTEEDRDRLELYQRQGSYPPRFRYMFYPQSGGQQVKWQPVTLTMSGTEPYQDFSFTVILGCGSSREQHLMTSTDGEVEPLIVDVLPHIEPLFIEPEKRFEFGHSLGLTVDRLTEIQFKYVHNAKQCLLHILLEWIKNNRDTFSYKHISEALLKQGYPVMSVLISKIFIEKDLNADSCSPPDDYIVIEGPTVLKSSINGYKIIKEKLRKLPNGDRVLPSKPSMIDLNRIIFPCIGAKWKEFGTEVKIEQSRLDIIEKNRKGFCQECFNDMVHVWMTSASSPFTWDTVVKALYSPAIKGYAVGEDVYMHLLHEYSQKLSGPADI